jgi:hypothetical protein
MPIKTIARHHQRTRGAIKSRLLRIAYNYMAEGKSLQESARLTGQTIKAIQRVGAPASELQNVTGEVSKIFLQMMSFNFPPISRAELQAIPAKRRLDAIQHYINQHVVPPVNAAAATGTSCFISPLPPPTPTRQSQPHTYHVTAFDLLEGIKAKYPDCDTMFYEKPVPTNRPGVTEQHTGILIDWS